MNIIRKIIGALLIAALCLSGAALADGEADMIPFATIGEAMDAEDFAGIAGSIGDRYVVMVKTDGKYVRLVADLDEKANELSDATQEYIDAETLEAAFEAFNSYIRTLPFAYAETLTAAPADQAELDKLAGKTLLEVEEAGYVFDGSNCGENDEAIYIVSSGLYDYNLILDATYTEYMEHNDNDHTGDLTVRSASFAGLSPNTINLSYRADGTVDPASDPWAEYNALMEKITEALTSGKDPEAVARELAEAMPEHAEEIEALVEVFSLLNTIQDTESGMNMNEEAGE